MQEKRNLSSACLGCGNGRAMVVRSTGVQAEEVGLLDWALIERPFRASYQDQDCHVDRQILANSGRVDAGHVFHGQMRRP